MWRTVGLVFLTLGVVPVASAIEEPAFKLLLQESDYEVRQYAPNVVAEVVVGGDLLGVTEPRVDDVLGVLQHELGLPRGPEVHESFWPLL